MARKKKAAKKTRSEVEAPPEPVEEDQEPEIQDPFDQPEPETVEPENSPDDAEQEKATEVVEEPGPLSHVEKAAAERGEKPSKHGDWTTRQRILDALSAGGKTIEDVTSADYYEMRGVTVLTMKDGKKLDVSD